MTTSGQPGKEDFLKVLLDNWRQDYNKEKKILELHNKPFYDEICRIISTFFDTEATKETDC